MTLGNMPAAEVEIDTDLVRRLLESQHPDLASLDLKALASGWDNVLYRLGDALVVRLPRRQMAADLVAHELRWLPELAPRLPIPIPAPVRTGRPELGYPWSWSITPWLPGEIAAHQPPRDRFETAEQLGAFLAALHVPAPPEAPTNPYRGGPLEDRAAAVRDRIEQLQDLIDGPATRHHWDRLRALPVPSTRVWIHGDLHPANVLVARGRISAVIDFGDISAGDRATDLSAAWMFLPPDARPVFRAAAGAVDDATWARAQGWAIALALAYVASSADNATMGRVGRATLAAVIDDLG